MGIIKTLADKVWKEGRVPANERVRMFTDLLDGLFPPSVHDRGTITTGTETPEWTDGEMQKAVNGGAHTLAAPTAVGYYVLTYTNNASAGAITATGWDRVDDTGSALAHVVNGSVVECCAYNDGISKRLIVTLIEDATP